MRKQNQKQVSGNAERLYIAYGSNLNLKQMQRRCPTAKVVGTTMLCNWELCFHGANHGAVATVEHRKGGKVPVLVWSLQPRDEKALDIYEGYPRLYRKETLRITVNKKRVYAMIYLMNTERHPYGTPSHGYLTTILEGYKSADFDTAILQHAVHRSAEQAGLLRGNKFPLRLF